LFVLGAYQVPSIFKNLAIKWKLTTLVVIMLLALVIDLSVELLEMIEQTLDE
jgi:hypothetical protein